MASEGPYSVVGHPHGGVGIVGPGNDGSYCGMARYQAEEFVGNLNKAYAEGRKSAEKELNEKGIIQKHCPGAVGIKSAELKNESKDHVLMIDAKAFHELLELANKMTHEIPGVTNAELLFEKWKKARGIE